MEMADWVGLAGIIITSVVGPYIISKQKASEKRAVQQADMDLAKSNAIAALVSAVETLNTKMDSIINRPCDGSANVIASLGSVLNQIQRDVDVIRDRGTR